MARTITQIKEEITNEFLGNETIQNLYGVTPNRTFEAQFSKISLESILFHTIAVCTWTLETLFDRHRKEISTLIDELRPHTLRWYVNKTKAFQHGKALPKPTLKTDSDEYDNEGKTEEKIESERIVKYASAEERNGMVYIKVATGASGKRTPLDKEQEDGLTTYLQTIKDAGVKLKIINEPGDIFKITIDIYYDAQVFDSKLQHITTGEKTVHNTIATFVENLPFNGEYSNSSLINALLDIEGVIIVDLKEASVNGSPITARTVPPSGYFQIDFNTSEIHPICYDITSN